MPIFSVFNIYNIKRINHHNTSHFLYVRYIYIYNEVHTELNHHWHFLTDILNTIMWKVTEFSFNVLKLVEHDLMQLHATLQKHTRPIVTLKSSGNSIRFHSLGSALFCIHKKKGFLKCLNFLKVHWILVLMILNVCAILFFVIVKIFDYNCMHINIYFSWSTNFKSW